MKEVISETNDSENSETDEAAPEWSKDKLLVEYRKHANGSKKTILKCNV